MITLSEKRSDLRGSTIIFFVSKCVKSSVRTPLLICSSFSGENGHPVIICSLTSTAQLFLSRGGGEAHAQGFLGCMQASHVARVAPQENKTLFLGFLTTIIPHKAPLRPY